MYDNQLKCYFTDLPVENINPGDRMGFFIHQITVGEKKVNLQYSEYSEEWVDRPEQLETMNDISGVDGAKLIKPAIADIKHIVRSLILNGRWDTNNYEILSKKEIYNQLKYYDYPKTPDEKMNYLFKYLYSIQKYDGVQFSISEIYDSEWKKLYFKNIHEFQFYLSSLSDYGLIDLTHKATDGRFIHCAINYKGLKYAIELENTGSESRNCFIAMSFDQDDKDIYINGILPILDELQYNPIKIDDEQYESDKTINDAMIAAIKKSKFVIADFTKQKRNVYYEAGYAAGRGMKVIYTCNEEYFNDSDIDKKSAFDTNHYPHIIWKDIEDLKRQLKNKIEAYIKE